MKQVTDIKNLMPIGMREPERSQAVEEVPEEVIAEYVEMVAKLAKPPQDIKGVKVGSLEVIAQLASNIYGAASILQDTCEHLLETSKLGYKVDDSFIEAVKTTDVLEPFPDATYEEAFINILLNNLHMYMGVAGELGELLDAIKKNVIYGKPLDTKNVLEECGDIMFYTTGGALLYKTEGLKPSKESLDRLYKTSPVTDGMASLFTCLGITKEEAMHANMDKLVKAANARYAEGKYSDAQAINRADKAEGE